VISPRVGMEWCFFGTAFLSQRRSSRRVAYAAARRVAYNMLAPDVCYSDVRDKRLVQRARREGRSVIAESLWQRGAAVIERMWLAQVKKTKLASVLQPLGAFCAICVRSAINARTHTRPDE